MEPDEIKRYQRQLILKGIGGPGQNKLKDARVLIVGAGGLGAPIIQYLAAAGVGHLVLADGDRVSLSNLNRQIVHDTSTIGQLKVESAAAFVARLNPHVETTISPTAIITPQDARICATADIVVDATDNLTVRRLVAKACADASVPMVTGAVTMFDGQVSVVAPHLTTKDGQPAPCFEALYDPALEDSDLPGCEQLGILGATTGVIGALMATEVIKIITGTGDPLIGSVLVYDGRQARFSRFAY